MKKIKRLFVLLIVVSFVMGVVSIALADEAGKVNINTATVKELVKLKRIGQKVAERIIQYREKEGPFEKSEDIMKVKGIGMKIFEANKDRITVK
jgi:competence protein ComEA